MKIDGFMDVKIWSTFSIFTRCCQVLGKTVTATQVAEKLGAHSVDFLVQHQQLPQTINAIARHSVSK